MPSMKSPKSIRSKYESSSQNIGWAPRTEKAQVIPWGVMLGIATAIEFNVTKIAFDWRVCYNVVGPTVVGR